MTSLLNITNDKRIINALHNKDIYTVEELLNYKPRKYHDLSEFSDLLNVQSNQKVLIKLRINGSTATRTQSGIPCTVVEGKDLIYGRNITVYYFSQPYKAKQYRKDDVYIIYATVMANTHYELILSNPIKEYRANNQVNKLGLVPQYRKIRGIKEETLEQLINQGLFLIQNKGDFLPSDITYDLNVCSFTQSLTAIHKPNNKQEIIEATKRNILDDILYYSYMIYKNDHTNVEPTFKFDKSSDIANRYIKNLEFKLTIDQSKAVHQLVDIGQANSRINALICGDVGCGKTEIAKILSLYTIQQNRQVVVMAPTTVLARQHYKDFKESFKQFKNISVDLLLSTLKTKEKNTIIENINNGTTQIIISTHSILSDKINIPNLGMVIIDEEHRFGVAQRNKLAIKYPKAHHISMSATPIPRSLALTMYGSSVELINIMQMPKNRKAVKTYIANDTDIEDAIQATIRKGFQVYIVAPAIDNESNMVNVEDIELEFKKTYPSISYATLTGEMNSEKQEEIFTQFNEGKIKVLISTSIIEVGINNPNAALIVIKGADRFGLAQLHQLRGRVGRSESSAQFSQCLLQSSGCNEESYKRLEIMTKCNDGFKLSQYDTQMRGVGQLNGEIQSGQNKYIDLMTKYPQTIDIANKIIKIITSRGGRELEKMEEHFNQYYDQENNK